MDKEVSQVILDFNTGKLLKSLNCTSIALVQLFQRYALIFQCISILLAEHLKLLLPGLIGKQQTTFVKGRKIVNNVLFSQELVKGYTNPQMWFCKRKYGL